MSRLLLVSNRLPVTLKLERGEPQVARSSGGLATGLAGPHERSGGLWIGWPGETSRLSDAQREELEARLAELRCVPVHLSASEVSRFYEGFSNGVLWPLFHYMLDRIPLHSRDYAVYRDVNERFAEAVAARWQPGDLVWVQDYQLMLVPGLLRERLPEARIGFFLHIPFPAAEVFRTLPWREEILEGLLGADLLGFHTLGYQRHFANSLLFALGLTPEINRVRHRGREVRFEAFPMGIDARAFAALSGTEEVARELARIKGAAEGQRLILGVDRLDYTKGIPRRLLAVERLLEREPALRGKIRFLQIAVPSRTKVEEYAAFNRQVNELVGRINGAYGTLTNVPLHYLFRSVSQEKLAALYRAAEVMLVTPLRDGMNLVAKEFVACRTDEDGVLVLSELAGAAAELGEAVQVNPYDVDGMADALGRALRMPAEERRERMRALRGRVFRNDVHRWADSFVAELERTAEAKVPAVERLSSPADVKALVSRLGESEELAWLLEYDGALVDYARRPEFAAPDRALYRLLQSLAKRPGWLVHLASGHRREEMERWFSQLPSIGLFAEHGLWWRPAGGGEWQRAREVQAGFKQTVLPILESTAAGVPGSFVEEKTACAAWHYRMADLEQGLRQAKELHLHLTQVLANVPVEVLHGDRVIEVRPHGVGLSLAVERLRGLAPGARMVLVGRDEPPGELFGAASEDALLVRVGAGSSNAAWRLPDADAARRLLASAVAASGRPSRPLAG